VPGIVCRRLVELVGPDTRSGVVDTVSALALFRLIFRGNPEGVGLGMAFGGCELVVGGGRNRSDVSLGRGRGIEEGVFLADMSGADS